MMDGLTLALIKALGGSGGAGAPGKSAYEIAVENGFEGTEQEWLESLVGQSAGFGTPTASATSLANGEQPTVAVSANGENAAKVFDFQFGIPAGADGKTPVKGVDYYTEADKQELIDELKKQSNIIEIIYPEGETVSITPEQHKQIFSESPPKISMVHSELEANYVFTPNFVSSEIVIYVSEIFQGSLNVLALLFGVDDTDKGFFADTAVPIFPITTPEDVGKIPVVAEGGSYEFKLITDLISNGDEVSY